MYKQLFTYPVTGQPLRQKPSESPRYLTIKDHVHSRIGCYWLARSRDSASFPARARAVLESEYARLDRNPAEHRLLHTRAATVPKPGTDLGREVKGKEPCSRHGSIAVMYGPQNLAYLIGKTALPAALLASSAAESEYCVGIPSTRWTQLRFLTRVI